MWVLLQGGHSFFKPNCKSISGNLEDFLLDFSEKSAKYDKTWPKILEDFRILGFTSIKTFMEHKNDGQYT